MAKKATNVSELNNIAACRLAARAADGKENMGDGGNVDSARPISVLFHFHAALASRT